MQLIYQNLNHFFCYFIKKHRYKMVSLFLTSSLYALSTSLSPYLIKIIVDNIINFKGNPQDIYSVVLIPSVLYVLIRISLSLFMRLENIIQLYTIPPIKAEIRAMMFQDITKHSYSFFQEQMSGSISNQILNMANSFERIYTAIHDGLFPCILSFAISAFIMYKTVPSFALFFTIWFVLSLLVTAYLSTRSIFLSDERAGAESALSGNIVDVFRNITTVLIFFNKEVEFKHLALTQNKELKASQVLEWELLKIHLFRGIATSIMLASMLILLIEGWKNNLVTIGDFTFVSSTAFNMAHLTWLASKEFVTLYKEWGIARQSLSLMQIPYTNDDIANAKQLVVSKGQIQFTNVAFTYPTGPQIFSNLNLTIQAGEKIGLVGFSGSGKTTFVKLIMRFFEPQNGFITIDNQRLDSVEVKSIRTNISMIPQDAGLFNRSILENILYGNPHATYDEVVLAAKKANCHDFIMSQSDGYHTIIGEQGEALSGGQRQRIAIARAALKNAPILILDEATSALDSITEQLIQQSIYSIMQDKTAIVVAHRLSTLMHLDKILVFDKGQIVETGSHQELLAKNGHYAKLWHMQMNGFILKEN